MACVEIRKLYGGQRGTRVRGFELVIQNPEIHVVLCTSISALDECTGQLSINPGLLN